MKKLLALFLATSFALCIIGCDDESDEGSGISSLSCNSVNGNTTCTCQGNGKQCSFKRMIVCEKDVVTDAYLSKDCGATDEDIKEEEELAKMISVQADCQVTQNAAGNLYEKCSFSCKGTGQKCEATYQSVYLIVCENNIVKSEIKGSNECKK